MDASLFYRLESENICFKSLDMDDYQAIHNIASDRDVSRFIGWQLKNNTDETRFLVEEMIRREAAGTHLYASIALKSTNVIIGTAMIFNFDRAANHGEVGYVFNKSYWSQGYATETVNLMCNFAFESLKLHKLHARVFDANIGSVRVLEKNGFELEGRLKDYHLVEGKYYDCLLFGKINSF